MNSHEMKNAIKAWAKYGIEVVISAKFRDHKGVTEHRCRITSVDDVSAVAYFEPPLPPMHGFAALGVAVLPGHTERETKPIIVSARPA